MRRAGVAVVLACGLVACSPQAPRQTAEGFAAAAPEPMLAMEEAADAAAGAPPAEALTPPRDATAPMLAYAYSMGVEAPGERLPALAAAHQTACASAGPKLCQVVGASTERYGQDQLSARLSIRAAPDWLEGFRARIGADAKEAGGRITATAVTSEDLTRQIVDVSARLAAQRALRDRLQKLLASRPGKLGELLEVERELARVQGELDSLTSNLEIMRTRVATSLLDIDYRSEPQPLSADAWEPLRNAFAGFLSTLSASLAALITLVAAALPFALVFGPLLWFGLRALARRRAKKAAPPA